jgi:hypothetical protein
VLLSKFDIHLVLASFDLFLWYLVDPLQTIRSFPCTILVVFRQGMIVYSGCGVSIMLQLIRCKHEVLSMIFHEVVFERANYILD